jgi:hypothetical protein
MYWIDIVQDLKDESIFRMAAEAVFQKRAAAYSQDWPGTHCLPVGPGALFHGMYRIIQSPTVVALLFNSDVGAGDDYRQIFLDGRELPKDPNPTWRGYSVGRWEGGTLVVETAGFNDGGWLDWAGHPHSEHLRVTEKFRRVDFGHMDFQMTFDDPEMLEKPLTISVPVNYAADAEMLEWVCENERDAPHLPPASQELKLSPETLAKYAGTYEFTGQTPPKKPWLATLTLAAADGRLYLGALPLTPKSETTFDSGFGTLQFSLDSTGLVKALTVPDGLKYIPKP